LEPVSWQKDSSKKHEKRMDDLQKKLTAEFVKSNRDRIALIKKAISDNDISVAHRMVHTLKSNAAQLGKKELATITGDIEKNLKNENNLVSPEQMEILEKELSAVLTELTPLVKERDITTPTSIKLDEAIDVISSGKLETQLDNCDVDSLGYIECLRQIPGSENVINNMEDMNFKAAKEALQELKRNWS